MVIHTQETGNMTNAMGTEKSSTGMEITLKENSSTTFDKEKGFCSSLKENTMKETSKMEGNTESAK